MTTSTLLHAEGRPAMILRDFMHAVDALNEATPRVTELADAIHSTGFLYDELAWDAQSRTTARGLMDAANAMGDAHRRTASALAGRVPSGSVVQPRGGRRALPRTLVRLQAAAESLAALQATLIALMKRVDENATDAAELISTLSAEFGMDSALVDAIHQAYLLSLLTVGEIAEHVGALKHAGKT